MVGLIAGGELLIAGPNVLAKPQVLTIPRVEQPPELEDFLGMKPSPAWEGRMTKVEEFVQRLPSDGTPTTQRTEVYMGYDEENIYCIFVAFDSQPGKVRAHKTPRDNLYGDERLDLFLDTYHDSRTSLCVYSKSLGLPNGRTLDRGHAQSIRPFL